MLRVTALYEHGVDNRPHGSAYIRTLLPLEHPSVKRHLHVEFPMEFKEADVLLIDRTWSPYIAPGLAEQILRQAQRTGTRVVYSLDDNLMDVNEYFPFRRVFSDEQVNSIRIFATGADHIVVSTEPLRERMLRLNPNVSVIPNALDERLFAAELPKLKEQDKIVLGYMGTASHEADLRMILEPLRELLTHAGGMVELELVGVLDEFRCKAMFGNLPVRVVTVPSSAVEYPGFVKWMRENLHWDVGLAPLENTRFTVCKSDIKWLDYSLLGIAGVFSRVPAYENSVEHEHTGLLASDAEEWRDALQLIVKDQRLRMRLRANAFDFVRENRTLAQCACMWNDLIKKVCA